MQQTGIYITPNLDPIALTYSDPLSGASPDVELELVGAIESGTLFDIEIGYKGQTQRLRAGLFEVDRSNRRDRTWIVSATGLPLSDPELKAKRDEDYSETALLEILKEVGDRYQLTVFAPNLPNIVFSQLQQAQQTDLEFLSELARRVGAVFKIENKNLIFTPVLDLEKQAPSFQVRSPECISYSEEITSTDRYQFLDYEVILFGDVEKIRVEDDRLSNGKVTTYRGAGVTADDDELLKLMAIEKLREINGQGHTFSIEIIGTPDLIAGSSFVFDGQKAFCDRALHRIDRAWISTLQCRFIP